MSDKNYVQKLREAYPNFGDMDDVTLVKNYREQHFKDSDENDFLKGAGVSEYSNDYISKVRQAYPDFGDIDDTTLIKSYREKHFKDSDENDFLKGAGISTDEPFKLDFDLSNLPEQVNTIDSANINSDNTTTRAFEQDGDITISEDGTLEANQLNPIEQDEKIAKENKEILFGNGEDFVSKEWNFGDEITEPFKQSLKDMATNDEKASLVLELGDDANNPVKVKEYKEKIDKLYSLSPAHYAQKGLINLEAKDKSSTHSVDTFLEAIDKEGLLSSEPWLEFFKAAPSVTASSIPQMVYAVGNLPGQIKQHNYSIAKQSLEQDGIKREPTRSEYYKALPVTIVIDSMDKFGAGKMAEPFKQKIAKEVLKNPTAKVTTLIKEFTKDVGHGLRYELPTEILQENLETAYIKDKDLTGEDILKSSIGAVMGTVGTTTGMATISTVKKQIQNKTKEQILADELNNAVKNTQINPQIIDENVRESLNPKYAKYQLEQTKLDDMVAKIKIEAESNPLEQPTPPKEVLEAYEKIEELNPSLKNVELTDNEKVKVTMSFEELFAEEFEADRQKQMIRLDELETLDKTNINKNIFYDFVLDMGKDKEYKNTLNSNKRISNKTTIVDNDKLGGVDNTIQVPAIDERNYEADFSLSSKAVERIKAGKMTDTDLDKIKSDIATIESHPDYALAKEDYLNKQEEIAKAKLTPMKQVEEGFKEIQKELYGDTKNELKPKGYVEEIQNEPVQETTETITTEETEPTSIPQSTETEFDNTTVVSEPESVQGVEQFENITTDEKIEIKPPIIKQTLQEKNEFKKFWGIDYTKKGGKGQDSVNFLLEKKRGHIVGAFAHKDIGDIDLVWGDSESGLKHILERRTEQWGEETALKFISHLSEIVEESSIVKDPDHPTRLKLMNPKSTAVIELTYNNIDKHWLMSAFRDSSNKNKIKKLESHTIYGENQINEPSVSNAREGTFLSSKASSDKSIANNDKESQDNKDENKILYSKGVDSPGYNFVKNHSATILPARPENNIINFWGEEIELPKFTEPTTTETMKLLIKGIIDNRLYKGKVKGKHTLGTYNTFNSGVRVKSYDQIEVMAHEMAHYLDFKRGAKFKEFKSNYEHFLRSISYTSKKNLALTEGFAEFVRLYTTNFQALKDKVFDDKIIKEFENILDTDKTLLKDVKHFRKEAHKYYYQGNNARLTAYSDNTISPEAKKIENKLANKGAKFRQDYIDKSHSAKIVERKLKDKGVALDAKDSAYKKFRLINGAGSTTDMILENGVPTMSEDGSLNDVKEDKNRKGLDEIFKPVFDKKNIEDVKMLENYFKAKRAAELHSQDRENKIPKEDIEFGLKIIEDEKYEYFEEVFKNYQKFNTQIMDFYVDMKLITKEQKKNFEEKNKDYVPFFRIKESISQGKVVQDSSVPSLGKRLTGGTATMSGIMNNIYGAVEKNVKDAYIARANSQLFQEINDNQGAEFAVALAPESEKVKGNLDQQAKHIATIMKAMGIAISKKGQTLQKDTESYTLEDIIENIKKNPQVLEFWNIGVTPNSEEGVIQSAIININGKAKKIYFEVKDPLIAEMIASQKGTFIGDDIAGRSLKAAIGTKNLTTALITKIPLFYLKNALRDTVTGGLQSESGFIPFYSTLKGMQHFIKKDKIYRDFMVNGGGYATRATALGIYDGLENAQTQHHKVATNMSALQRVLSTVVDYGSDLFEMGGRIEEFRLTTQKKGKSKLEGAYQGRDTFTDFANGGTNETIKKILSIMAFAKAGVNSMDKLYRVFTDKEHSKKNLWLAGGAITSFTMLLWGMNKDDERYKKLTADQKSMYWHVYLDQFIPKEVLDYFHIPTVWKPPKPHQIGMLFANIPELVADFTHNAIEPKYRLEPGELTDRFLFDAVFNTGVFSMPSIVKGAYEIASNETWNGMPIETMGMQYKAKEDRSRANTPDIYKALGNSVISPVQMHHLSNSILGLAGRMLDDGMNKLQWDEDKKGEQVFTTYNPLKYLAGSLIGKEVEARTKYDATFYDTHKAIIEVSSKLRGLKKDKDKVGLKKFYADKKKITLMRLKKRMDSKYKEVSDLSKKIKNLMEGKSVHKKADTKELLIQKYYLQKHAILKKETMYINDILQKNK